MREQDRQDGAEERPQERPEERPEPDQHDPATEEDTASGGPAQPPDHSR